jgi:hypothetical protein
MPHRGYNGAMPGEKEFEDLQVRRKIRTSGSTMQTIYVLYRSPSGEPLEGIYADEKLAREVALEIASSEKVNVWVPSASDPNRFVRFT